MKIGKQTPVGGKIRSWLIVVAGIIFSQALLYGPSLIGEKVLLPLDMLTVPGWYIPQTSETAGMIPHDVALSDMVDLYEPARQFSVSEIQHGRFPLWSPFQYCGVPVIWPKFSPFLLLEYTTSSPVILAWGQLLSALVAGMGMYLFGRRLLRVSFWPAAIGAWLYPLTTFFILWYGAWLRFPVCWLPWVFVSIDHLVRRPGLRPAAGLSMVTWMVLISGNIDVAGQVLLGGGIYALWCLWDAHGSQPVGKAMMKALALLVTGWALGFMLSMPHLLPLLDYAQTGSRMIHRSQGTEERPPTGLAALPQVVLPDMYGTTARGSCFIMPRESNLLESASLAYIGVFATMLIAPLAWLNPSNRKLNWFWAGLAFFGLSWCLNIPGFVQVLRLPGLNMMSHNRLAFLTAFALFALALTGLENVIQGRIERRKWFWIPAGILIALSFWCLYRGVCLPEPVATQLGDPVEPGVMNHTLAYIGSVQYPDAVQGWFALHYSVMAVCCGIGFAGWLCLWSLKTDPKTLLCSLTVLMAADLLWFDHGRCVQGDPRFYYPNIPAFDEITRSAPGRVIGLGCLPATLSVMQGMNEIRGYDSIDPARMTDLIQAVSAAPTGVNYAKIQCFIPKVDFTPPNGVHFPPIIDMLGVRYGILQGNPPKRFHPDIVSEGYYALINSNALPRAFVPQSVEMVANSTEQLQKLGATNFNPRAIAYVSTPVNLPPVCEGQADITNEIPTDIQISVQMKTPGMVVLADRWDKGWQARWNGSPVPILQANYAIRGVVLPAGSGTLEFIYRPASLIHGCYLAVIATVILLGMALIPKRIDVRTESESSAT